MIDPDRRHCPACGFMVGRASWCMECGWRDETKPKELRRLDTYVLLTIGSVVLLILAVIAAMQRG